MTRTAACFVVLCLCGVASPQQPTATSPAEQWGRLIDAHQLSDAEQLCTQWTSAPEIALQAEAQKCLANVTLAKGSHVALNSNETGSGTLGEGYTPEAADLALKHLNEGLLLAPQDLSIHQGRLFVLEVMARYEDMDKALEENLVTYKGPHQPYIWLAYSYELGKNGEPTAALHFTEVLDKHFPNNPDIIGNIGAFHNMLKQWDEGIPYVRHAVELRPNDPLDTWNLGWSLSHTNQDDEAEKWMRKSLAMPDQDEGTKDRRCLFGHFLVDKRSKTAEGCKLVSSNCESDDRKGCVNSRSAVTKPH